MRVTPLVSQMKRTKRAEFNLRQPTKMLRRRLGSITSIKALWLRILSTDRITERLFWKFRIFWSNNLTTYLPLLQIFHRTCMRWTWSLNLTLFNNLFHRNCFTNFKNKSILTNLKFFDTACKIRRNRVIYFYYTSP